MSTRSGDVVLQLHAKAWLGATVQRLSLIGRGLLVELLMQFALGYRTTNIAMLAATTSMREEPLRDALAELVVEGAIVVVGQEVSLTPETSGALLLGLEAGVES